ncbi:macro domain-containing protein [Candidatus Xianfuyuplasma coldseepsis]|uniref:RNase III inhibitor n=1 Tax=Candidatus Xianfuyuplasma coldseepsis TaxID=2782163 RepID=A0A7L7KT38_9MOLU|nr:macro domain-containing protein [Xianfuyuplasma coldseepsis]QMS85114.1 RNase III inhibitor [Xianfuyuplasma coldseepsis]
MPLLFVRNDITNMDVNIIVNSTSSEPAFGHGVDFAIYDKGGEELVFARQKLGYIRVCEAKFTLSYNLPCDYVIHTVGPYWRGYGKETEQALISTYQNVLKLAEEMHCESIAFPLISSGQNGLPKLTAFDVAKWAIRLFLNDPSRTSDMTVYLVLFDKESYNIAKNQYDNIYTSIDTNYTAMQMERERITRDLHHLLYRRPHIMFEEEIMHDTIMRRSVAPSLDHELEELDDDFRKTLFQYIDESGMTDPEVYHKANVTKETFNKIKNRKIYNPSKKIILALCVALELPLNKTNSLLRKAGMAFSPARKFDVIVRYFIREGIYRIDVINEYLYDEDQDLLGSK